MNKNIDTIITLMVFTDEQYMYHSCGHKALNRAIMVYDPIWNLTDVICYWFFTNFDDNLGAVTLSCDRQYSILAIFFHEYMLALIDKWMFTPVRNFHEIPWYGGATHIGFSYEVQDTRINV